MDGDEYRPVRDRAVLPAAGGDRHPDTAESYDLGNGSVAGVDQRRVIDAGFLELTRLGELPVSDPDVLRSLRVVDSVIGRATASGRGDG